MRSVPVNFVIATLLLALLPHGSSLAHAQETGDRKLVAAARADALANLRQNVLRELIGHEMTVADLIVKTDASDRLTHVLSGAETVGGPRWIGHDSCQIQVELSGSALAEALEQIAAERPDRSPVPSAELHQLIADWSSRSFTGIGSSAAAAEPSARAREGAVPQPWAGVSPEAREKAIAAATQAAIAHVEQACSAIAINSHQTIADALAIPAIHKAVDDWLAARPIARVRLRDDLQAEVTLNVTPGEMYSFLQTLLEGRTDIALPPDAPALAHIRDAFAAQMGDPVGRAPIVAAALPQPNLILPRRAPAWVLEKIEGEGTAIGRGSRLLVARVAEAEARRKLREGVDSIRLDGALTLGIASQRDHRIKEAVDHAVRGARVTRTIYNLNGSVTVHVTLLLQDVWDDLHDPQAATPATVP